MAGDKARGCYMDLENGHVCAFIFIFRGVGAINFLPLKPFRELMAKCGPIFFNKQLERATEKRTPAKFCFSFAA